MLFLISLTFATWLGLTIAYQFIRPSSQRKKPFSVIPLAIPQWTFFAPLPGRVDYRVVYQDYRTEDEPVGSVREIPLHVARSFVHILWNPGKRRRKAFLDIAQLLQQMQEERLSIPSLGLQATTPYLAVLNVVMATGPVEPAARFRRFLFVYTAGFNGDMNPRLAFVSSFHPFYQEASICV